MCLKLGWDTNQILDTPHFENQRRFNLYTLLDEADWIRPVTAVPIISSDGMQHVTMQQEKILDAIRALIGLRYQAPVISPEEETKMKWILEKVLGEKLKTPEEIITEREKDVRRLDDMEPV